MTSERVQKEMEASSPPVPALLAFQARQARPWLPCLFKEVERHSSKKQDPAAAAPHRGGGCMLNADGALCFVPILLIPTQQKCC